MLDIRIEINGQAVDVDVDKVPLVFTRRIDKWEDFIGSEGAQAKSLNDTLYLPATKKNADILANLTIYNYNSQAMQGLLFVQVFVNNFSTFAGSGQRVSASKSGTLNDAFAIKVIGDSADVFSRLADLSLRELPLGDANTTSADIEASWTALSVTTNPLVFAPIYYGGSSNNQIAVFGTGYNYKDGLRPSVRIWKILSAIFEAQLGYEIVSNIYQTEAFRNLVYPFSVGDDWKRSDDVTPYKCFIGCNTETNLQPPAKTVKFNIETPPYSDPMAMNFLGGIFKPSNAGWYRFTFRILTTNVQRVVLRGQSINPNIVNIDLGQHEPNTTIITEPILFEPNAGLTSMFFSIEQDNPALKMSVFTESYYKAELIDRFAYGKPLDIASCLHDKTQKDFLRGLQHLFGLVFGIDNINKKVYIDPRFVNTTQAFTTPECLVNQRDAYYDVEADVEELRLDKETSIEHRRPFGDSLSLGFAEDSSDALYTYFKENADYTIPLFGSRIDFIASETPSEKNLNPFFAPLLTLRLYSSSNFERQARWGCIVDDFDEDLVATGVTYPVGANYTSAPKIAMYYGVLDFIGAATPLNYEWFYLPNPTTPIQVKVAIPTVLGVFPNEAEYITQLGGIPFNLSYAAITYDYPTPALKVLGLIDRYHSKYLSMIYNDKFIKASAVVNLSNYRTDLFKAAKLVNIGGQATKCWQVSTEGFAPTKSRVADIVLIADYDNIEGATYTEVPQGDNPLFTTGSTIGISNTGN